MIKLSQKAFDSEVLNAKGKVVVDVYADWCQPCKMLKPIIEKLATAYADSVKFYVLDGETEAELVTKYSVNALPTILIFEDGELKNRLIGLQSEKTIKQAIEFTSRTGA